MHQPEFYIIFPHGVLRCAFFFFNDTATTEIYTLSLHDALPISHHHAPPAPGGCAARTHPAHGAGLPPDRGGAVLDCGLQHFPDGHLPAGRAAALEPDRSEEHTSELQSLTNIVCRLLLAKQYPLA